MEAQAQQAPQTGFSMKSYDFNDFSGGITDNFLDGGPTHYLQGDNFWITVDKNLQERNGTIILDPVAYNIPGNPRRIGGLWTMINESILLAQAGRNLFYYTPNVGISSILGPNGVNEPLGGGDIYSAVVASEFQRHMYFASDSIIQPSKIYRDNNNVWQTRTAGLPRATGNPNLTNDQVLALCIANANSIRNSMINHIQDLNQHVVLDKVALNYFVAQTFNPGDELPPITATTLGSCTDLNSLMLLVGNLNLAYEHQRADASKNGQRLYHNNMFDGQFISIVAVSGGNPATQQNLLPYTGMHVKLANQATPTLQVVPLGSSANAVTLTLAIVAAQCDDILQKWSWHRKGCFVHSLTNDYPTISQYDPGVSKIGTITTATQSELLTANLTDAFNFANNCKYYYNTHVQDGGASYSSHTFADGQLFAPGFTCTLPDCSDFDSYANLVFWLRILYQTHYNDAANNFYRKLTISTDASTPANLFIPVYTNTPTGPFTFRAGMSPINQRLPVSFNIFANPTDPTVNLQIFAGGSTFNNVVSLSAISCTTSFIGNPCLIGTYNNLPQSIVSQTGYQYSFSKYHVAKDSSGNVIDAFPPAYQGTFVPNVNSAITSAPDAVGVDAKTWNAYASELYFCIASHATDTTVHVNGKAFNNSTNSPTVANAGLFNVTANAPGTNTNGQNQVSPATPYVAPYTPFFIPTIASYIYAFVYTHTYQVEPNGLFYTVQSNPIQVGPIQTSTIIPPGATVLSQAVATYPNITYQTLLPVQISNLPSIVNTANTNYDTSVLTLDIYRSTDGGTTYYKDASLTNGTASYSDVTADSVSYTGFPSLNTQQPLYTTGGVVGNDQPPQAGCIATLNGYTYYGNIIDTGQPFPNRIRQSLLNNPDSAPATFFDDLEDNVVGLAGTRNVMIALCGRSIYRLNGNFNSLGQGLITHERISQAMGCVSAKSIVSTEIGIFFAGLDGFYYTDGYQLIKITIDLNSRYQSFTSNTNQQKRIVGAYDRYNRRVYWTLQSQSNDTNPDSFWVYYLDYGVKPQGAFTTASNFTYFRPASVVAYQGNLIYGHELGYFLKFDNYTKTDPLIDTTNPPANWQQVYIPYTYASCTVDFHSLFQRKYTTKVHMLGGNIGNVQAQIVSIRDNRQDIAATLAPIQFNYNPMWGQPLTVWKPGDLVNPYPWEYDHKLDAWRRFPAGNLRCDLKQLIISPSFTGIYRYEDWPAFCFAAISGAGTSKTVTISTPTGYTSIVWPTDVVNYVIAFSTDGFVAQYLITAVGTTTLTIADPGNVLTTLSNLTWVIRGYRKQQRIRIDNLQIYYDYIGDKNDQYLGKGSSGENV